ncbi:cytochrome b/b6 domain-containing protein [Moritella viscosa]|nr:cytochrome b/b6 domain-containing protein [Moritella viscosa]SGY85966.1 Thiosulfate reductase cytochrome B subunit [Moritella viscosa]SGY86328.1 Thiosulfate reductase cytochrome B subunit [Moritella viscosa]
MPIHSGLIRILHALNAISVIGLISSGWAIFNASPLYPISFPVSLSLGGYLTEALQWHFLLIWLFVFSSILFVLSRLLSLTVAPNLWPISIKKIVNETQQVLTFNLKHYIGEYNHIQRMFYLTAFLLFIVLILSGLGLWKPVQFQVINYIVGGYENMRRVHFWAMVSISTFIIVHLSMVIMVPSTLLSMIFSAKKNVQNNKNLVNDTKNINNDL